MLLHIGIIVPGTVMLKLFKDRLILTNPGGFIGGISPNNILHHPPIARNAHLMDLLDKLKFVNRSNIGVPRIYQSLLIEGKEPPQYAQIGEPIELTIIASPLNPQFRSFIKDLYLNGIELDVDHLIVLNYLLRHREIETSIAAEICQRDINHARELLAYLEHNLGLLEAQGVSKKYYLLTGEVYSMLGKDAQYARDLKLDLESIKIRILSLLKERNLTNVEIRQITGLSRQQVLRLIRELEPHGVRISGVGRGAYYYFHKQET